MKSINVRNPSTWKVYEPGSKPELFVAGRGFTRHEHLPWFNLINMNGRVYDPLIAMFLSPDNYVQNPDFTQNFNRYGYCLNNPLSYKDPSGNFGILATLAIIAAGEFVFNLVGNMLENKMTLKEAIKITPITTSYIGTFPYHPAYPSSNNYGVGGTSGSQTDLYTVDPQGTNYLDPTGMGIRYGDKKGSGIYGASRDNGTRYHLGLDFLSSPLGNIYSPASGEAYYFSTSSGEGYSVGAIRIFPTRTLIGPSKSLFPYVNYLDILYINVPSEANFLERFNVTRGQVIGTAMDLTQAYPSAMSDGMQNHVHLQINYNVPGVGVKYVNPYPFFTFKNYIEIPLPSYFNGLGQ